MGRHRAALRVPRNRRMTPTAIMTRPGRSALRLRRRPRPLGSKRATRCVRDRLLSLAKPAAPDRRGRRQYDSADNEQCANCEEQSVSRYRDILPAMERLETITASRRYHLKKRSRRLLVPLRPARARGKALARLQACRDRREIGTILRFLTLSKAILLPGIPAPGWSDSGRVPHRSSCRRGLQPPASKRSRPCLPMSRPTTPHRLGPTRFGAALVKRVAGRAQLGGTLAALQIGARQKGAEVDRRRCHRRGDPGGGRRQHRLFEIGHIAAQLGLVARRLRPPGQLRCAAARSTAPRLRWIALPLGISHIDHLASEHRRRG